jgi:hypothetical protein
MAAKTLATIALLVIVAWFLWAPTPAAAMPLDTTVKVTTSPGLIDIEF